MEPTEISSSPIIKESRDGGRIFEKQQNFPETAIHAEEIKKSFFEGKKELEVLRGINLEIRLGEIVAIVGPSGAGKSTLLHLLGVMDNPSSGKLKVLGWDINTIKESEKDVLRNKYIGFLFQFHYLLSELTLLENVALPQRILGSNKFDAENRASALLGAVGLKDRVSHYPSEVSGGEQQRAALARAMINHPAILICDEPTGNLDLERGEEVRDLIWRITRAHHSTVLVATHNLDMVKNADRVIRIVDGKVSNH